MTLVLTPDVLATAYDFLRTTQPFVAWNLPEPEDVEFRVISDPTRYGWCDAAARPPVIAASRSMIGHTMTLMETMAHEMIHLHEDRVGARGRQEHTAAFKKWAAQVCAVHGFDPKRF